NLTGVQPCALPISTLCCYRVCATVWHCVPKPKWTASTSIRCCKVYWQRLRCRGNVHFLPLCTTGYRRVHSHGVMAQLGNRLFHWGDARASGFGRYSAHSFTAEGKHCTQ